MTAHADRARQLAGTTALRLLSTYGIDTATEMYRGILIAFALSLQAVSGKEKTYQVFVDAMGTIQPERSKPKLVINNEVA